MPGGPWGGALSCPWASLGGLRASEVDFSLIFVYDFCLMSYVRIVVRGCDAAVETRVGELGTS